MNVEPIPKPRKSIRNKAFLEWLATKPCIYCGSPATEPHHDRTGYGDGKGCGNERPDDYRALRTCHDCHVALHSMTGPRYREMTQKIGREEIYFDQIQNLLDWQMLKEGVGSMTMLSMWPDVIQYAHSTDRDDMETYYVGLLDNLIEWIEKERG